MPTQTTNTGRGRPKSVAKGEAILDAAQELMLEHGYSATSLEMIAERADVGKPTIYSRFESKEGLFNAIIARRSGRMDYELGFLESPTDEPRADLIRVATRFSQNVLSSECRRWDRLVIAEAQRMPSLAQTLFKAGPRKLHRKLTRYIERQVEAGRLSTDVPEIAAEHLIGLMTGFELVRGQMASQPKRSAKFFEERARRIVDTFLAAYGAE